MAYKIIYCRKCGGLFEEGNVQWIRWGKYHLCNNCLKTEVYTCNQCRNVIRYYQTNNLADLPCCKECVEPPKCACCGGPLHERFPFDFPSEFKFCCVCHKVLLIMIEHKDNVFNKNAYDLVEKMKKYCYGTVREINPLI